MSVNLDKLETLHCIGECHALRFRDVLFRAPELSRPLRCSTRFLPTLPAEHLAGGQGCLNDAFWKALVAEGLCYLSQAPETAGRLFALHQRDSLQAQIEAAREARLSDMPLQAPAIVLFFGELDVHSIAMALGEDADFELPGDPGYGLQPGCRQLPFAEIERALERRLAPLELALVTLRQAGFSRTFVHGLPPRSAHQEDVSRWIEGRRFTPAAFSKLALLANRKLAAVCARTGTGFVDTWAELSDDGFLHEEFRIDGLHLSQAAVEPSLAKVAQALCTTQRGDCNEAQYQLLSSLAERRNLPEAEAIAWQRGWHRASLCERTLADLRSLRTLPRQRPGGSRPGWTGSTSVRPDANVLLAPSERELAALHAALESPEVVDMLAFGSEYELFATSCRLLGEGAARWLEDLPEQESPPGCRRALLAPSGYAELRVESAEDPVEQIRLQEGDGIVFDPRRKRVVLVAQANEGIVLELNLIPRLPSEPRALLYGGCDDWPIDPFYLPLGGVLAHPPQRTPSLRRWREIAGATVVAR